MGICIKSQTIKHATKYSYKAHQTRKIAATAGVLGAGGQGRKKAREGRKERSKEAEKEVLEARQEERSNELSKKGPKKRRKEGGKGRKKFKMDLR